MCVCVCPAGLCEVNIQNKAGFTAVMLACLTAADASEDMEVALQLLREGDINTRAGQVHTHTHIDTHTYTQTLACSNS